MLRKQKQLVSIFIFLFSTLILYGQVPSFEINTVVIDAGHGGKDPGAVVGNTYEKNIVLNVALATGRLIQSQFPEVKVIFTRDKDVFIPLDQRASVANKGKADLFISIHTNVGKEPKTKGTETYILGQHRTEENLKVAQMENSVILMEDDYSTRYEGFDPNSAESYIMFELIQNEFLEQSRQMADQIETNFTNNANRKSRGVRQAGFLVLRKTSMPSILIELGFISNSSEKDFLTKTEGQELMAQCITNSFATFRHKFGSRKDNTNQKTIAKNQVVKETENNSQKTKADSLVFLHIEEINLKLPFYAIQIAASPIKLKPDNLLFKDLDTVYIYNENNLFKYYCCINQNYDNFIASLKSTKTTIKDAFPVIFKNGKKEKFQKL